MMVSLNVLDVGEFDVNVGSGMWVFVCTFRSVSLVLLIWFQLLYSPKGSKLFLPSTFYVM